MSRITIALAGATALALAAAVLPSQFARAADPASAPTTAAATSDPNAPAPHGWRKGRGERMAAMRNSPVFQTVRNLRELERLYLIGGRASEIPALYQDVLAKTGNPAVRQFAYNRIALNQFKPGDVDKSIATLRQSLDESLQRLPAQ